MNKSNSGKQRCQWDTIIPMSNPVAKHRSKEQKMTLADGRPKGLKCVLEEHSFNVHGLCTKCLPVCPIESQNCCMACLLSQQYNFQNQPSILETLITEKGNECIFLPKFHCELNPIEMVCIQSLWIQMFNSYFHSTGAGANIDTERKTRRTLPFKGDCHPVHQCLSCWGHPMIY